MNLPSLALYLSIYLIKSAHLNPVLRGWLKNNLWQYNVILTEERSRFEYLALSSGISIT